MSSSSTNHRSNINLPRMILWLASIVVAVAGYVLLTTSNSREAAIYVAGKADYPKLFAAQSGSTIGGLLVAVGVLGALLALLSLAVTWRPAVDVQTVEADVAHVDSAVPDPATLESSEVTDDDVLVVPADAEAPSGR